GPEPALPLVASVSTPVAAGPEPALPLVASVSLLLAAGPEPALPLVASVSTPVAAGPEPALPLRSEERRVGKGGRCGRGEYDHNNSEGQDRADSRPQR